VGGAAALAVILTWMIPSVAVVATADGGGSSLLAPLWQTMGNPLLALGWAALAFLPFARPVANFLLADRR
jgi:hypothetical protein